MDLMVAKDPRLCHPQSLCNRSQGTAEKGQPLPSVTPWVITVFAGVSTGHLSLGTG